MMRINDISPALLERFWASVNKDGPIQSHCPNLGPCWVWTGRTNNGYGYLSGQDTRLDGRGWEFAHRLSWIIEHGSIPVGLWVLHRCDTPPCIRPSHLFLGTSQENTADRVRKGRSARTNAEKTHCSKGHPFNEENTRWYRGHRSCRICTKEYDTERTRQKQQRLAETTRTCPWCSQSFTPKWADQYFCRTRCYRNQYQQMRRAAQKNTHN